MKDWNLKQLKDQMIADLGACNTQLERDCCKAISGKGIREAAERFAAERKLTPAEVAIASEFGYRHK